MGEFAKWAEKELPVEEERPKIEDWRDRASGQTDRLRKHMPLTSEIGTANATALLKQISTALGNLGYNFRMRRHRESPQETSILPSGDPGIPGRDISITLPKEASWMETRLFSKEAVGPIRAAFQEAGIETKARMREKRKRALAPGTDPMTVPGFVPAAVIAGPESFRRGFTQADKDTSTARNDELQAKLDVAKEEFEQALTEEYKGRKMASAGEWIDGLTQSVFTLEKSASQSEPGEAMRLINVYLGLASLLGYGSFRASKRWTESRDPARQKHKLYRMAVRQRMHDKGVPVVVDFEDLPAARARAVAKSQTDDVPLTMDAKEGAMTRAQILGRKIAPSMAPLSHEHVSGLYRKLLETLKPVASAKRKVAAKTGVPYKPSLHGLSGIATPEQLNAFRVMTPDQKRRIFYDVIGR